MPYFEYFPNGQIKYLIIDSHPVVSSHLYLEMENGDLARVNYRDFIIFNENGEVVESFALDSFYGAIRAAEIRNLQVETYGFSN